MKTICLYFEIHQNIQLKRYRFFDIGTDHYYYDDYEDERLITDVANRSYMPALEALGEMLKEHPGFFKVAFSLSGVGMEQLEIHAPQVLEKLQELNQTGCVEFLAEPYSHGLASLANEESFAKEVKRQCQKMKEYFGKEPKVLRNSSLIYSDDIGAQAAQMGFKGMLTEGNTAHRRITGLATLGEGVVNWNKADYLYYRNRRLQADSLLNLLKRHCREYVRPEQIDTLRALLAEKETHLLHIMEMFERRTEADSVLVNQLPEVARRATHIRTIEQKKKGIAGFFGKKEEIQVMPSQKELHDFSDSLIAIHQRQASEMDIYADSLRMRNRELNRTLNKLINDLDEQAQTAFSQRELKMAEAEKMSFFLMAGVIGMVPQTLSS